MSLIQLKDVYKIYAEGQENQVNALDGVTLSIDQGEFVAIIGTSGSGKSTMMNILGCLDVPTRGEYLLDGTPIRERTQRELSQIRSRQIAFIFQGYNLIPSLNVWQNVALPMLYQRVPLAERRARAMEALEKVEIAAKADNRPAQLSGGQQQRVAIARAIAARSPILMADEPTGALDSRTGEQVLGLMRQMNAEGTTVILITHDNGIAAQADRTVRVKDGRIVHDSLWDGVLVDWSAPPARVALVSGYNADITAYYEKLGVNKVNVTVNWYDTSRSVDVIDALYDYGNGELGDMVLGVSPDLSTSLPMKYRTTTLDSGTLYLGSDQFSVCGNYTLKEGRDISAFDVDRRSRVCVLGSYVADSLFQYADPIGETVYFGGEPFTVVGIYYQKDGGEEGSMDDMAVIPYSLDRAILGTAQLTRFSVKVDQSDHMDTVMAKLERFLGETIDTSVGEYELENGNSAMSESTEEMTSMSVVLGGIAGIALLVGGIGIMNIMLVTVTERTREIGIKKSIGAPRREIVGQFLVEAAILSALGGLIGSALGYLLSLILGKAMYDLILYPDALVTAGAFAFSVAIGIVFGIYPAAKASGLQPVDALRAD